MLNMQKWLISADTEKWDHEALFARDGYIHWRQYTNYEVGDIVYIYAKKPIGKVMFKTVVEEESIYLDDTHQKYAKLRLIKKVDNEGLSLDHLREFGLNIPPQKALKFYAELQHYVERFFDDNFEPEPETKNIWLIHESDESQEKELFKNFNYVAGDWQVGDLSNMDKESAKSVFIEEYKNFASPKAIDNYFSQYDLFVNNIKVGDYIISSNNLKREYILGKCVSDYYFSDKVDNQYHHYRDVEWLYSIKWDDISQKARNYISNDETVIEIKDRLKNEFMEFFRYIPYSSHENRNKIYFGAPGTGKSYILNKHKDDLLYDLDNYERVTFHPDYTYGNFVGSYKPISEEGSIKYEFVPGPFMRVLKKALDNPSEPYLLIIEEINRANVAAVFGDVFQLLDRDNYNKSDYPIETSEEVKRFLNKSKIRIPSNMFIWATMNSADQGVFPMDTAFKRRWDFEYLGIDEAQDDIKNIKVEVSDESWDLKNKTLSWNKLRQAINNKLLDYKINEDKLIGPFFAFDKYVDKKLEFEKFKEIFQNKVIMYLFEDAARAYRNELFGGEGNKTFSQICKQFDEEGIKIFCEDIRKEFIKDDGE